MKSRNEVLQFKNISVSKRKFKLVKFSAEMIVQPGTPQILPAQSFLDQIKEKKPDLVFFFFFFLKKKSKVVNPNVIEILCCGSSKFVL